MPDWRAIATVRATENLMAYELPELPYAHNALEPHIDVQTMEIHHGKHHATYIAKLNGALEGHGDLAGKSVNDLISDLDRRSVVYDGSHGAQVVDLRLVPDV